MERTSTDVGSQRGRGDASLQNAVKRFNEAFNRFDAKEVAACWADDGTLINPVGDEGRGRAGVERVFHEDAESILSGTTSTFTITAARPIGNDCVFLDLDHDVQNFHAPDGTVGPMKLHVVLLAQRKGDTWKWLDARPYGFMPRPRRVH